MGVHVIEEMLFYFSVSTFLLTLFYYLKIFYCRGKSKCLIMLVFGNRQYFVQYKIFSFLDDKCL